MSDTILGGSAEPQGSQSTPEPDVNNQPQGDQPQGSEPKTLPGWTAGLKAEVKEKFKDRLGDYQTISDIIPDYFELKDQMNRAVIKPGEDASEEEIKKYREALGVPGAPEEYELDTNGLPEGLANDEDTQWFKKAFHTAGLDHNQAKNLYREMMGMLAGVQQKDQEAKQAEMEQTKQIIAKEYGDDIPKAMAAMNKTLSTFGSPELINWFNESGAGNSPELTKFVIEVGKRMLDDNLAEGSGSVSEQDQGKKYLTYPKMEKYYQGE